jgi:hypothetical protein
MFYSFCFNKVPSKAFGIVWMIVDLILWKDPKLGDAQGTPRQYSRNTQATKLGDAPDGIPPFVFNIISNLTWDYIFIRHMICVLLGASFYFICICLLLFIIMFCIFYFNKSVKYILYHA